MSSSSCGRIHALDGMRLSTVDDPDIVDMIIAKYVKAFYHVPGQAKKLEKLAPKGTTHFVAVCQIGRKERVDTRNVKWSVLTRHDPQVKAFLPWKSYNPRTHIMVHVRIFYGENKQAAYKTFFAKK